MRNLFMIVYISIHKNKIIIIQEKDLSNVPSLLDNLNFMWYILNSAHVLHFLIIRF